MNKVDEAINEYIRIRDIVHEKKRVEKTFAIFDNTTGQIVDRIQAATQQEAVSKYVRKINA